MKSVKQQVQISYWDILSMLKFVFKVEINKNIELSYHLINTHLKSNRSPISDNATKSWQGLVSMWSARI